MDQSIPLSVALLTTHPFLCQDIDQQECHLLFQQSIQSSNYPTRDTRIQILIGRVQILQDSTVVKRLLFLLMAGQKSGMTVHGSMMDETLSKARMSISLELTMFNQQLIHRLLV